MFWCYNHHLKGGISSLLYILENTWYCFCGYLKISALTSDWCFFLEQYLRFTVWKIVLDGVKRRIGSLPSGKTLVWPLSSQNLIHTDIEFGWFASLCIQLTRYWCNWSLSLMLANLSNDGDVSKLSNWLESAVDGLFIEVIYFSNALRLCSYQSLC